MSQYEIIESDCSETGSYLCFWHYKGNDVFESGDFIYLYRNLIMSHLVLARKYRPQSFEEIVQQDHVTRTLCNAIVHSRIPHALIFAGPRGTGKTTMARILAKAMNCLEGPTDKPCQVCRSCLEITSGNSADVNEIDGASNNRVNQARELRNSCRFLPIYSRHRIIIIDEVHMLSPEAFNALLKIIEEPPAHIIFVFATTELQEIPITILSRCQRHDFRRIAASVFKRHMQWICDKEQVSIDEESLTLIAREANGSMRDAVGLLEHILTFLQGQVKLSDVTELLGIVERRYLFKLSAATLAYNIQGVLRLIDSVWCAGYEIIRFYDDVTIHFYQLVLVKLEAETWRKIDLPIHEIEQMKTQVKQVDAMFLLQILDLLLKTEQTIKTSTQPKLALEMTFLKMLQAKKAMSIETLIDRLDRLYAG